MSRAELIQKKEVMHVEEVDSDLPEDSSSAITIAPTEIHFPEISMDYDYLRELFLLSGQAMSSASGIHSLTWTELSNFRKEYKGTLHSWEIEMIKKMSESFCSEYSKASDPQRKPPYTKPFEDITFEEKFNNASSMLAKLMAFNKKRQ